MGAVSVPLTNRERQQRFRARQRAVKAEQTKLIINARLGTLSAKQRALAAAALTAISEILARTTNQGSELCRGSPQHSEKAF
jgi:hypothetical protein